MKEYLKPEVEFVDFTVEEIANTSTVPGEDDGDL